MSSMSTGKNAVVTRFFAIFFAISAVAALITGFTNKNYVVVGIGVVCAIIAVPLARSWGLFTSREY